MTVTIEDVIRLSNVYEKIRDTVLPIKTGYKLAMFFAEMEKHQEFYKNSLNKIIFEYSQRDEKGEIVRDGDNVKIQEDKIDECQEKLNELANLEVAFEPLDLSIEDFGDIKLTMDDIVILTKFIEKAGM